MDSVPESVHHVVYRVDPQRDASFLAAPQVRGKATLSRPILAPYITRYFAAPQVRGTG